MHTLTSNTRANQQKKNRLSVKNLGVGLAGLGAVNQRIPVEMATKLLLLQAVKKRGVVKIVTTGTSLEGEAVDTGSAKTWGEKMDKMAALLKKNIPSYFVLFRSDTDCLIVTFVPDSAKPQKKMLYASNKESVKDALIELDEKMELEEYNVAEIKELNYAQYQKKASVPKPFSEHELSRQEQDQAPTAGNYGILARLKAADEGRPVGQRDVMSGASGAAPMALPGISGMGVMDMGNLRASLRPIGKVKVKKTQMKTGISKNKIQSKPAPKSTFQNVPKVDGHYEKVKKEFGVEDRELKAKLEIDLILSSGNDFDDEMKLPTPMNKKSPPNEADIKEVSVSKEIPVEENIEEVVEEEEVKAPPVKPKKPGIIARFFGFFKKKKKKT